uniref:Uncharacterized protein n=1 Tax=Entamoeba invadens TaxID=33085 RepID=S0AY07_ENTIV|nr:hypothetical protein [Entamoeba invadens]
MLSQENVFRLASKCEFPTPELSASTSLAICSLVGMNFVPIISNNQFFFHRLESKNILTIISYSYKTGFSITAKVCNNSGCLQLNSVTVANPFSNFKEQVISIINFLLSPYISPPHPNHSTNSSEVIQKSSNNQQQQTLEQQKVEKIDTPNIIKHPDTTLKPNEKPLVLKFENEIPFILPKISDDDEPIKKGPQEDVGPSSIFTFSDLDELPVLRSKLPVVTKLPPPEKQQPKTQKKSKQRGQTPPRQESSHTFTSFRRQDIKQIPTAAKNSDKLFQQFSSTEPHSDTSDQSTAPPSLVSSSPIGV